MDYGRTCQTLQSKEHDDIGIPTKHRQAWYQIVVRPSACPDNDRLGSVHAGMVSGVFGLVPETSNCVKVETPDRMGAKRPASLREMSEEGDWMEQVPPLVALAMAP